MIVNAIVNTFPDKGIEAAGIPARLGVNGTHPLAQSRLAHKCTPLIV